MFINCILFIATAHGQGVYFAVNASYSASPTYSPVDPQTRNRYIYSCLVLTGDYTAGNSSMRVPPAKKGAILYDTLVDNITNPQMFITFNDSQAYPEYLVVFQ